MIGAPYFLRDDNGTIKKIEHDSQEALAAQYAAQEKARQAFAAQEAAQEGAQEGAQPKKRKKVVRKKPNAVTHDLLKYLEENRMMPDAKPLKGWLPLTIYKRSGVYSPYVWEKGDRFTIIVPERDEVTVFYRGGKFGQVGDERLWRDEAFTHDFKNQAGCRSFQLDFAAQGGAAVAAMPMSLENWSRLTGEIVLLEVFKEPNAVTYDLLKFMKESGMMPDLKPSKAWEALKIFSRHGGYSPYRWIPGDRFMLVVPGRDDVTVFYDGGKFGQVNEHTRPAWLGTRYFQLDFDAQGGDAVAAMPMNDGAFTGEIVLLQVGRG